MDDRTLKGIPPIKRVMTPFPYSIDAGESLIAAQRMMASHGFRHLPVMSGGRLEGVISERDIQRALDAESGRPEPVEQRVGDVPRQDAVVVDLSEPLDRVLSRMSEGHLGAVLVVKEGKLAGIFTVTDACSVFAGHLRQLFPDPKGTDAA
jgi:acetoin utilization protein AcuB